MSLSAKEKWMSQLIADFFVVPESEANVSCHSIHILTCLNRNCLRKKPLGTIWSNLSLKLMDLRDSTSIFSSLSIRKAPEKMKSIESESTPTLNSMLLMETKLMMLDLLERPFTLSRLNLISGLIRVPVEMMTIQSCSESFLKTLFILWTLSWVEFSSIMWTKLNPVHGVFVKKNKKKNSFKALTNSTKS